MNPTFLHSVLKLVGKEHIKRYHSVTVLSSSAILYFLKSLFPPCAQLRPRVAEIILLSLK